MEQLRNILQELNISLNNILQYTCINLEDKKLELFLHSLEKSRFEIYEQIDCINQLEQENYIYTINNEYKANLKDNILSLYIPEKLPNLKNKSSYVNKRIIMNIANVSSKYKGLFYDKFVIVIIKIFDKRKIWDVDNRTVKPIQDGLIYGEIIKDDNLFNCCYMVQGLYSDKPHIEVSILEADQILKFIDKQIPNIGK